MDMDTQEFTEFAKTTIDFVADYYNSLRNRDVLPNVEPGYLSKLLPEEAPHKPEKWQEVLKDVEQYIMPGVSLARTFPRGKCAACNNRRVFSATRRSAFAGFLVFRLSLINPSTIIADDALALAALPRVLPDR